MKIAVEYIDENIGLEFIRQYGRNFRLWIYDNSPNVWFRTISNYCPHRNMNGFECQDCAGCYD